MDKIKIFINKYTNQIILGLLLVLFVTSLFFTINRTLSDVDHKEFVYIYSDNTDFNQGEPGGWILYKSAYLLNKDRLRIKYKLNSNSLLTEKSKDVLFVIDRSEYSLSNVCPQSTGAIGRGNTGSSTGSIDAYGLLNEINNASRQLLLEEQNLDNKVAIMTYNDTYELMIGLTDDQEAVFSALDGIEAEGYTDYSKALLGIKEFLTTYQHTNDRELKIVLYAGNVSKENNLVEKAMYDEIKRDYPFVKIYALHNVVDDKTILEKIANISDAQFLIGCSGSIDGGAIKKGMSRESYVVEPLVAAITPIRPEPTINIIFSQIIFSKEYSQFKIKDTINNEHFNFTDFKIIDKNNGDVTYSNNDLIWTLDRKMLTGDYIYLEVELGVNQNVILTDNLVPVSTNTQIKSILEGIPDENIDTSLTPYVSFYNKVIYNTSELPETCNTQVIPSEVHKIGDIVDTKEVIPNCDGYRFIKWIVDTNKYYYNDGNVNQWQIFHYDNNVAYTNNMYLLKSNGGDNSNNDDGRIFADIYKLSIVDGIFNMPGYDVILTPLFDKISVNKSFHNDLEASLISGENINDKMRRVSSCYNNTTCSRPTSFKRATTLNSNNFELISTNDSEIPVYVWFSGSDDTIYYYTAAEKIYMNDDSSDIFETFPNMSNISGFEYFDTSRVTYMRNMFKGTKITDLTPISNWNVSNVENMEYLFSDTKITNVSALSNWNVEKVEKMSYLFNNCKDLSDINGLQNWKPKKTRYISHLFSNCHSLTDISVLANWRLSGIYDMSYAFYDCKNVTSIAALSNWDTEMTQSMAYLFAGMESVTDISPISHWFTLQLEDISGMFSGITVTDKWDHETYHSINIENLDALSGWRPINVLNASHLFYNNKNIQNIDVLSNWGCSRVQDMSYMLYGTTITDASAISNWVNYGVQDISFLFAQTRSITNISFVSNWSVGSVKKMDGVFSGSAITDFSPISNWSTGNVTSLAETFFNTNLDDLSVISNWNTSKVTNMSGLFWGCDFTDLTPIANWNVEKVENMSGMFRSNKIIDLDPIANWDVSKVNNFYDMFKHSNTLTDASGINDWNINPSANFKYMFGYTNVHPEFTKVAGTWNSEGTFIPGGEQ